MADGWPPGPDTTGPLRGVRVLDLSRVLAGPYAAMLLGDLGADVIKVEHPAGDETRRWGPPFLGDTAVYYLSANRNKRSVVLDLAEDDDRQIAQRLARSADVVIENFLPGTAERFGLGHAEVRGDNAGCVYCSVTSFGRGTAHERRKGYDLLIQALGGMMGITGPNEGPPVKVGVAISDLSAGLFATIGVLAGLAERSRTGTGAHVEVPLLDAQVSILANQAMNWLAAGENPERLGSDHPNVAPYGAFATRTADIVVGAGTDRQFVQLCEVLGREEWAADPRFATNAARVGHRAELRTELEQVLVTRDAADWLARFEQAGVVCGPIRSVREVFEDPYVAERLVDTVKDAELGAVPQVMSPIRVDGRAVEVFAPPPGLGADTEAVRGFFADDDGADR